MPHDILTADPGWKSFQKRRDKLEHAREVLSRRTAEIDRQNREALQKWQAKVDAATLEGKEPPEQPESKQEPGRLLTIMRAEDELEAEERAWLAENAARLEEAINDRIAQIYEESRPRIAAMNAAVEESNALLETVRTVRQVSQSGARLNFVERADVGTFVDFVTSNRSLLEERNREGEVDLTTLARSSEPPTPREPERLLNETRGVVAK